MPTTGSVKHRPKGVSNTDRREYQTPINRPAAKLKKTEVTANPAKRVITCLYQYEEVVLLPLPLLRPSYQNFNQKKEIKKSEFN